MRSVYDVVTQILGDSASKEALAVALLLVVLRSLVWPVVIKWRDCRQYCTAHYTTNHALSRAQGLPPAPYQTMPRRQGREAVYLRKLFDNPVYLHQYIALGHKHYGPVFRDGLGSPADLVFLADAGSVPAVYRASGPHSGHVVPQAWTLYLKIKDRKRGIFFMDGPEWAKHRRILNQRMQRSGSIKQHMPALDASTATLMDTIWRQQQQTGQLEDTLRLHLYTWSLECISVITLGRRIGSSDPRCEFSKFVAAIHAIFQQTTAMGQMPPEEAMEQQTEAWCRFCEACDTALDIASRFAREAVEDHERRGPDEEPSDCLLDSLLNDDDLSEEMATRLIADLFLAAADTTVWNAIWLLFVMARHPEFAASARQQINTLSPHPVDGDSVLTLDMDDLKNLSECRNILKETLRLYPVAPFVTRLLATDSIIAGYHVPAKTMLILSVYSIGRDPKYFTNPQKFDPRRWESEKDSSTSQSSSLDETHLKAPSASSSTPGPDTPPCTVRSHSNGVTATKLAAMPWGIGPRNCVGRTVAENMLTLFLAHVLHNFDVALGNKEEVHLKMQMISVPSENLDIQLTRPSTCAGGEGNLGN